MAGGNLKEATAEAILDGTFDVIVAGLGAMGSAAAYHLAKRGAKVLGLEARTPAHDQGSSHGESRIIRQAYFEDPAYVPLVLRAYELWRELEAESGQDLLNITGGLAIGSAQSGLVTGCLKSAREHGLAYELLDAKAMKRRFPQFVLAEDEVGVHEEQAGFLRPEECIRQHLRCAANRGAELRFEEPILKWTAERDGVSVVTDKGTYHAERLILSAGPWTNELVALPIPLKVSRRVVFWFRPTAHHAAFDKAAFPVFLWEPAQGPFIYGIPRVDEGGDPKVAIHHEGEDCTPSTIDRSIHPRDLAAVRSAIESRIPALNGEVARAVTCMYTLTPDEHFIIDTHPQHPQVSIAAGFSGHGFKFSSVVGEILADLALTGRTARDIALFSASRAR